MLDAVSQTSLNEHYRMRVLLKNETPLMLLSVKCLFTESSKREVDRNRDYSYDLEAYAMEVKEAQYPEYANFEQSTK